MWCGRSTFVVSPTYPRSNLPKSTGKALVEVTSLCIVANGDWVTDKRDEAWVWMSTATH